MSLPSTATDSATKQVTRRAVLASGSLLVVGTTGCVGKIRDRFDPRTYHSDATLGEPPEPWPTLAQDARRTSSRSEQTALAENPTVTRVAPSGSFTHIPPTLAGDAIFAAVETNDESPVQNGFVTIHVESGRRWDDPREKSVTAPAVQGSTVILTSAGLTKALDRKSGEPHWEYAVGTGHSAPTVVDEMVYIGGKHLVALDAVTGERRWQSTDVPKWPGRTAATTDTVFAAGESKLYAVAAADGAVQWTAPLGAGTYDTPVVGEQVIIVTESDSTLRGIDRTDGSVRWTVELGKASQNAPAIANGRVYVVDESADALRSFDAASGNEYWQLNLGPVVSHRPAIGGDAIYVQSTRDPNGLAVVDAETGEIRRTVPLPVSPASGVALANESVFFVGQSEGNGYGVYQVG